MINKVITLLFMFIFIAICSQMITLVQPVSIKNNRIEVITKLKTIYGITEEISSSIYNAHIVSGYNPLFIAELVYSESGFNPRAISKKGYKGILQTPVKTGYINADMIHGIEILQEKFRLYPNTMDAIAAYKGGKNNPVARKQAKAFLKSYEKRASTWNL